MISEKFNNDDFKYKNSRNTKLPYNRSVYGDFSIGDFDSLIAIQDFKCAICRRQFREVGGRHPIHLDHDHKTKQVRGVLCRNCNHGLGQFKDSTESLASAITYLENAQRRMRGEPVVPDPRDAVRG